MDSLIPLQQCICTFAFFSHFSFFFLFQKKLHETEHALFDLEERHRQANATIKEKEYLISNLLKSGERSVVFLELPQPV